MSFHYLLLASLLFDIVCILVQTVSNRQEMQPFYMSGVRRLCGVMAISPVPSSCSWSISLRNISSGSKQYVSEARCVVDGGGSVLVY